MAVLVVEVERHDEQACGHVHADVDIGAVTGAGGAAAEIVPLGLAAVDVPGGQFLAYAGVEIGHGQFEGGGVVGVIGMDVETQGIFRGGNAVVSAVRAGAPDQIGRGDHGGEGGEVLAVATEVVRLGGPVVREGHDQRAGAGVGLDGRGRR